ncbi:hypothetical protein [Deinococcus multiflagellatus]|uniref:Uncharacterized protein n=1 Tax=Deinococcus multiflagellatus TaxID=1656887 RepID=A0ABW1ZPP5_9DEIO
MPRGQKTTPARWVGGDAAQYRAYFLEILADGGEDALAPIWNDAPRGPQARLTRWYCPGVPMYATGQQEQTEGERPFYAFLVPAQAALLALERGLVTCRPQAAEPDLERAEPASGPLDEALDFVRVDPDDREGGPYTFDGTCFGCAAQSLALNRWNLCFPCATDLEHQTYPPEPT